MEKHKYYDLAVRAHQGTSFTPEKRALSECAYYDEICAEFMQSGKEWAIEKFSKLFEKHLHSKSRCVSFMIAGPARFPVERMEKISRWAHNDLSRMVDFVDKVRQPPKEKRTEHDYGVQANEYTVNGVRVLHKTEENRLQLFFDGKPEPDTIAKLKSNGYKWSPRNVAWQRQLTPNAIRSLSILFPDAGINFMNKARGAQ